MLTSKVAKRYAQGLLDYVSESGSVQEVFSEMKDLVELMKQSKELRQLFASPVVDSKKKISIASEIFKDFSTVSQNIITLVIKQGRESHLQEVAQEYINKVEDLNGVQRATLSTATTLDEKTIDSIVKSSNLVNVDSKFELNLQVNPELLGGYILRVGDQQIDRSVRSQLNQIKKDFQLN